MKKFPFILLLFIFACTNNSVDSEDSALMDSSTNQELQVDKSQNDELVYESLRIYPITASKNFIKEHQLASSLMNLKEAIDIKGFRITEKKPYGRFEDSDAVNNLTVQNKSQDTIYLMAGDVVQGGKQDRVLAEDMVLAPRSIQDIPVFCVEPHRWDYKDNDAGDQPDLAITNDHLAEQNKKIFAFTGYYNVASNDLRKTMKHTNDQQAVWNKVGDLTALNNAESTTGAYANLENSESFTVVRNEYLAFFAGKFNHRDDVIGMIAVSGAKVLGTDIFTHPDLFKKQYEVLIHSYITEATSNGSKAIMTNESIDRYSKKLFEKFTKANQSKENGPDKYFYKGKLIHFSDL